MRQPSGAYRVFGDLATEQAKHVGLAQDSGVGQEFHFLSPIMTAVSLGKSFPG